MAKKTKLYKITRRTLNKLVKLIPAKRRKNVEVALRDRSGVRPIRKRKASPARRRNRAQTKRRR